MESYHIDSKLGGGSGGSVFRVVRLKDRRVFVLKRVPLLDLESQDRQQARLEMMLLEKFHHPHVVPFVDSFLFNDEDLCIVMAYYTGGDLQTHLVQRASAPRPAPLAPETAMRWFVQIALAVHYLHSHRIVHRDIKTSNVFIHGETGSVAIGDFGVAKILESASLTTQTTSGTPLYMAPEVLKGNLCTFKSDIWALGCVLYEMLTFRHPFEARDVASLVVKVCRGTYIPIPKTYDDGIHHLVSQLLEQDPLRRPFIDEILLSPAVKPYVAEFVATRRPSQDLLAERTLVGQLSVFAPTRGARQPPLSDSPPLVSKPHTYPPDYRTNNYNNLHPSHYPGRNPNGLPTLAETPALLPPPSDGAPHYDSPRLGGARSEHQQHRSPGSHTGSIFKGTPAKSSGYGVVTPKLPKHKQSASSQQGATNHHADAKRQEEEKQQAAFAQHLSPPPTSYPYGGATPQQNHSPQHLTAQLLHQHSSSAAGVTPSRTSPDRHPRYNHSPGKSPGLEDDRVSELYSQCRERDDAYVHTKELYHQGLYGHRPNAVRNTVERLLQMPDHMMSPPLPAPTPTADDARGTARGFQSFSMEAGEASRVGRRRGEAPKRPEPLKRKSPDARPPKVRG